jgi:PAS domain S-box-containing protein
MTRLEDTGYEVLEYRLRTKTGDYRWISNSMTVARDDTGRALYRDGVIHDITAGRGAQEKEIRNKKILEGINSIFLKTMTCATEEELGAVCLEVIEILTESAIGFIGEIGPDGQLYDITISNPGWEACAMTDQTGHRRPPGRFRICGLYGRVLQDGKSLFTNDPATHPDSIGIPEGHPPLTSFLGAPLIRDGKTAGLIAVGNRDGGYTQEQEEILEALAPAILQSILKKRMELDLTTSEMRFRAFFENAEVGITELNTEGQFLQVNNRLGQITGYSAEELRQMNAVDLSPPEDLEQNKEMLAAFVHGPLTVFDIERPCRRKNGDIIWVQIAATKLRDTDDKLANPVAVVIDITKRKQAEIVLAQQTAKLEAANKELESFAYSVSHDLRAPLRAIDGFSRMLITKIADKLNDDEKRRFEVIRENTQRMGRLIDDILAFSRFGRQSMVLSVINISELINQVWEELVAINPNRRMSLKIEVLPDAVGDATLIRQVLANLLSNAVKFTQKKETALIEVGSRIEDSEVVYSVRDNGAGFDMDYSGKLFGVFQRLHSQEEYEGTGAGLAIVQRIIQRHGGRVWAEGAVDKGATFYFTLPKIENNVLPDLPAV